jgi:hypothetical protein
MDPFAQTHNALAVPNGKSLQLKSYGQMLIISLVVVISAVMVAVCFNRLFPLSEIFVDIFEFSGYILWGTGLARPKVDFIHHCIPSKLFYHKLQLLCSQLGIFVFVLARSLEVGQL